MLLDTLIRLGTTMWLDATVLLCTTMLLDTIECVRSQRPHAQSTSRTNGKCLNCPSTSTQPPSCKKPKEWEVVELHEHTTSKLQGVQLSMLVLLVHAQRCPGNSYLAPLSAHHCPVVRVLRYPSARMHNGWAICRPSCQVAAPLHGKYLCDSTVLSSSITP